MYNEIHIQNTLTTKDKLMLLLRVNLLIITMITSGMLSALELGELKLASALGEPLNAQLQIRDHEDFSTSSLSIKQAPMAIYEKMGVDRSAIYQELRFEVDPTGVLTISSQDAIKEPYMNFILQFHWAEGKLYREFNLLIDPPAR